MFTVEMLPACEGDCLWITYGDEKAPHHILIDGGRLSTAAVLRERLDGLGPNGRIELVVVSHIDRDHIEGILKIIEDAEGFGIEIGDFWFNGYRHLTPETLESQSVPQGDDLTKRIIALGLPWNAAFGGKTVHVGRDGPPNHTLAGGMKVTVLSPTPGKLAALLPVWEEKSREAGLNGRTAAAPDGTPNGLERMGGIDILQLSKEKFRSDGSKPNGTSIALLLEYANRRVLLAADAHVEVLMASLDALHGDQPAVIDLFKVSHHGSTANTSVPLIDAVACRHWMISTNGDQFKHPDQPAVARLIQKGRAELIFNYRTEFNGVWDDAVLKRAHGYATHYPPAEDDGYQAFDVIGRKTLPQPRVDR